MTGTDPRILALIDSDYPLVGPDGQATIYAKVLSAVEDLLKSNVDVNYQGERVLQLMRLEKADNFYRGIQNIAPSMDPATGSLFWVSYGQAGTPTADSTNHQDYDRIFDYNPRITAAYGKKFTSVLGQRPFYDTAAEPMDPKSETDRMGARQVNLLVQMLHTQWKVRKINHRLAYKLYKTGTAFGHTKPDTDGQKYGFYTVAYFQEPQLVTVQPGGYHCLDCGQFTPGPPPDQMGGNDPMCAGCAKTVPAGMYEPPITALAPPPAPQTQDFPRTSICLEVVDGYVATHPYNVVELEDTPWFITELELEFGKILQAFPKCRDIVGPDAYGVAGTIGDPAQALAAVVRASSQSQTGTIRSRNTNLRTFRNTYLEPEMLELIRDDPENIRDAAKQFFPTGIKLTACEGKTIGFKKGYFGEEWSSCLPSMADYLFADGESWAIFGLEDGITNLLNIAAETYETGITKFLCNLDYINVDAANRNRYSPNRFIGAIPNSGASLSEAFANFPASDPPQGLPEMMNMYKDFIEGVLGLIPAVYGVLPENITLGQATKMINQGLLQLSTTAEMMSGFWEQTDTNAVKMYLRYGQPNPQFKGQTIDLDLIRNSNWVIRGPSGLPRTFSERKEAVQDLITQNPDAAKALHVTDPINYPVVSDLYGLPELKNPAVDMVEAIQEIVDQLWQGQPTQIPGPDGNPTSQPSIQFDPLVFDPSIAVSVAQYSLVDRLGQQRQMTPGYANVRAFLQAAQTELDKKNTVQPQPPRLGLTLDLAKTPPEQEMSILQKYGIQVQPSETPSFNTQSKVTVQEHKHATDLNKTQVQHTQNLERDMMGEEHSHSTALHRAQQAHQQNLERDALGHAQDLESQAMAPQPMPPMPENQVVQ